MVKHHIGLTYEMEQLVRLYSLENKCNFSDAIRRLITIGLNRDKTITNQNELENKMNILLSRQKYTSALLEQLYTDMEIENLLDPKNCIPLQKFKNQKLKDYFND